MLHRFQRRLSQGRDRQPAREQRRSLGPLHFSRFENLTSSQITSLNTTILKF